MLRVNIPFQLWSLSVEPGTQLKLTFDSFSLEGPDYYDDCSYDYVEVSYDGYSEKFCGDSIPPSITSSGNSMTVKFFSDDYYYYDGFNAVWESV